MIVFISKFKAILFVVALLGLFTGLMQYLFFQGKGESSVAVSADLKIKDIKIMYQQEEAELYPLIEIEATAPINAGSITIENIAGVTQIEDRWMTYRPKVILQPDTTYQVSINIKGVGDTTYESVPWSFTTRSLDDHTLWVEVALTKKGHRVYIREGKEVIREMLCSGGTEEEPTIFGTYYLENRGDEFFAERFNEGAKYWVRIKDQYLFHSIPRDREGRLIQEELEKIGSPASHGCVRLLDEDAKWFYENIHDGTMVIIHD